MGVYSTSGKINTTTVSGSTYTGIYAADGGWNIVLDDSSHKGIYHPCGALRVNSGTGLSYYDTSGAVYSNHLGGPGMGGSAAAPATPTLTLTSGTTVNTPTFSLTGDLVLGDIIRFQYSTDSGFAGTSQLTQTIDALADAANILNFATGPLALNTWYFRARIERPGHLVSAWSNTQTETIVSAFQAETTAWINAVVAAGGAVSDTQKSRVDTLINTLKSNSLFVGRIWLHAGESDVHQVLIDLKDLAVAIPQNTPALSAGGFTGNGTNRYIDYGTLPASFTRNDAAFGAFCTNARAVGTNDVTLGMYDGVNGLTDILQYQNASGALNRMNSDGSGGAYAGNTSTRGLVFAKRSSNSFSQTYFNGTPGGSSGATSQAIWSGMFGLARNDAGTATSFSSDTLAVVWIGPSVTDGQEAIISSAISAYITAWGV